MVRLFLLQARKWLVGLQSSTGSKDDLIRRLDSQSIVIRKTVLLQRKDYLYSSLLNWWNSDNHIAPAAEAKQKESIVLVAEKRCDGIKKS